MQKNEIIFDSLLFIICLILFCLSSYIFFFNNSTKEKNKNTESLSLSYNQVVRSRQGVIEDSSYFKSTYEGESIFWLGKISNYYSQVTGIKFCISDNDHPDIDTNEPCDWFWAYSDNLRETEDSIKTPNWDGNWVTFTLNYYKVPFEKYNDYHDNTYWIKGTVKGIDCISPDRCVPDIDIISIIGNPGPFDSL